ncbi:MAG: hypothetical protein KKG59_01005 [Nanoarchaeota archaeon]|nr:hypothetical protein [Nanoarchaeota archaeon]
MDFCVKCGKKIKEGVFCTDCSKKGKKTLEQELTVCACGKIYHQKRWAKTSLQSALAKRLKKKGLQLKSEFSIEESLAKGINEEVLEFKCGSVVEFVKIKLLQNICDTCQKQKTGYFQGILQVRTQNPEVQKAAAELIGALIRKKGSFISKVVDQKRGVDLWFSDNKRMKNIGIKLNNEFGGTISHNPRLFGRDRQKSKDLYRLNVHLELPHFFIGDVIDYKDDPVLITKMGKPIKGDNLKTGKRTNVLYDPKLNVLKKHDTTISQTKPDLEAINPLTFQSDKVMNAQSEKKVLKSGQKVKVVCSHGIYLVKS